MRYAMFFLLVLAALAASGCATVSERASAAVENPIVVAAVDTGLTYGFNQAVHLADGQVGTAMPPEYRAALEGYLREQFWKYLRMLLTTPLGGPAGT